MSLVIPYITSVLLYSCLIIINLTSRNIYCMSFSRLPIYTHHLTLLSSSFMNTSYFFPLYHHVSFVTISIPHNLAISINFSFTFTAHAFLFSSFPLSQITCLPTSHKPHKIFFYFNLQPHSLLILYSSSHLHHPLAPLPKHQIESNK